MYWFLTCITSNRCVVEGGYVWFDVGTEFLGAISYVESHCLEGGVVVEFIVREGAEGVDLSDGENNEEEEGTKRKAVAVLHHHDDWHELLRDKKNENINYK